MAWKRLPKQRRQQRQELRIDFDDLAAAEPSFDEEALREALTAERAEGVDSVGETESDSSAA